MARVRPPFIIQPDTPYSDAWARVNENFANIASDISDYGSFRTSTATITVFRASGSPIYWNALNVTTSKSGPLAGLFENLAATVTPRLEVFVDNDNDDTYSFPLGTNLDTQNPPGFGILRTFIYVNNRQFTSSDPDDLVVASIVYGIENGDISDRTYYLHISADIFPRSITTAVQGSPWR